MSISAINEQLLRAIGVGIAIAGKEELDFRFHKRALAIRAKHARENPAR